MPKVREDTAKLREMRIRTMKQKTQNAPSEIYLCVLGNGASGSPRCLFVFTDHSRYLFNCGEGTQRLAHEHKMKLSKLNNIFITHNSWENFGGLLGLCLTIQDIGVPQLTLHGPQGVENVFTHASSFSMPKGIKIEKRQDDFPFVDNCMEVEYVPIFNTSFKDSILLCEDAAKSGCDSSLQAYKKRKVSLNSSCDMVVAYICKGHSKKGHLLMDKCLELGVPKGPLLGELKRGKDIILPSGKVVHSLEVMAPDEPCPVFLVVECPSEEFLEAFVLEKKFQACQNSSSPIAASLVVHFTPPRILKSDKYQEWMNRFPGKTEHLILNTDNDTLNSASIHRIQSMLNLLHPRVYSLLHESDEQINDANGGNSLRIQAKTMVKYYLLPHKGLDKSSAVSIEPESYVKEAKNAPGFEESLRNLHKELQLSLKNLQPREEYPEIVFLGTGSSLPSKARNVSGILINVSNDTSVFLDCGEGTYNQLFHLYGAKETLRILRNVSCIFISHMHADHHLGIFTILKERKLAFDAVGEECPPVTIIAPFCIDKWLKLYSTSFEFLSSLYRYIDCSSLQFFEDELCRFEEILSSPKSIKIFTVPVVHCPNAYGSILTIGDDVKLVYSGDTVPSEDLVEAGKHCTVLIHEATMEDDLEEEASYKMHSTTSQAIDIAEKMNATYTILTHFSQRYAKIPVFNEKFHSRVGCAFDNMKVRMCDLPIVSCFIPTLKILFAENVEKLLDSSMKRKEKLLKAETVIQMNHVMQ